ncbi:MAG: PaaI family thioesterase [Victivallaceae bacterium]|nr:PaaI family thioesterase [Victivallaceae bacterium]
MNDPRQVADFLNARDAFCRTNGIRLVKVAPEYAEAELDVTENTLNADGIVQGGAIFTLADLCFAGAANASGLAGNVCVSLDGNIRFVRPGTGKKLRAVCRGVSRGRRTGVYLVEVFNEADQLVAHCTFGGFVTGAAPVQTAASA